MLGAGAGLQGIHVSPRFVFGVNGDLRNNIHLHADHQLVYAAGHNVIVYNTEDKSQFFHPGSEGTHGITALNLSPAGKYVAVCEKGEKGGQATCTIFDFTTQRKKKALPEHDCKDYTARKFVAVDFSKNEKSFLITLTGKPDWMLLFWQWDKIKITAKINIGIQGVCKTPFQATFCPHEHNTMVVTGIGVYKYYKLKDNEFTADLS